MQLLAHPVASHNSDALLQEPNERHAKVSLKRAIRGLMTRLSPHVARDRREYVRHPLPALMELTPVDAETEEPLGSPVIVVGKSISEQGLGFFHQHAMPYRNAIVRVEAGPAGEMSFLVDLAWCRYTQFGWYESGGRFLRLIDEATGQ
jgi:hypothetical protein